MIPSTARAIWSILVRGCGASDIRSEDFLTVMTGIGPPREYRFQGSLGFGGKFYTDSSLLGSSCPWRIGLYREDRTPERDAAVLAANAALRTLWETME